MTENAKFRYSAQDGVLELEGSEEFVSKHFESLTDIVRVMARQLIVEQKKVMVTNEVDQSPVDAEKASDITACESESIKSYPNIYSEINGKLKITTEITGSNMKLKMTNAALFYCYGAMLMGDVQVPSTVIREVCEEYGCLDGPNFAKIFDDKTLFVIDGTKGGTKQVKLTFTGQRKAKELLRNASLPGSAIS